MPGIKELALTTCGIIAWLADRLERREPFQITIRIISAVIQAASIILQCYLLQYYLMGWNELTSGGSSFTSCAAVSQWLI
ncbi:hypothetical protein N7513_011196 [Penicillium frequentans]|nr:hypothetical protein N7513_011196 [Penicillium glabrum]